MEPDVTVVGGGAIGVCIAYELALRGAEVLVLERGARLGSGCSEGNAGLICPSHSAPLASPAALRNGLRWLFSREAPFHLRPRPAALPWLVRFVASCTPAKAARGNAVLRELSVASLELHHELAGLDTGYERSGTLDVYETEAGFAASRAHVEEHRRAGRRAEVLAPADARGLEPALTRTIAGAVFWPDEAHCDPERFVAAVGAAAVDAGAAVRTACEVRGFDVADGRIRAVDTSEGRVATGAVVLAAGAWTPRLARALRLRVPVEGGKGYHLELETAPSDPRVPLFLKESWVIATPLAGRLRLAGTLELAGLDLTVDRRRADAIFAAARRTIPGVAQSRLRSVWSGLRPCTPDGLPIVGRAPALENVVLATGHTMLGLTLAPLTGRLVAQLVTGEAPSHDLGPLRPERF